MTNKKTFFSSNRIGKLLSRFKLGMSYLTLAMACITAFMTTKKAYPEIEFEWVFLAIPLIFVMTILLGYYLDKLNITSQDQRKSNEMTHRFLLTSDIKSQEFQLLQTEMLLLGLKSLKQEKDIDVDILMSKYKEYVKKWNSPANTK